MITLYYAELKYGDVNLAKLECEDRGTKTYKVVSHTEIHGWFYGRTVKKDDPCLHATLNGAFRFLEEEAREHLEAVSKEYAKIKGTHENLAAIVEKIKTNPTAAERAINELIK